MTLMCASRYLDKKNEWEWSLNRLGKITRLELAEALIERILIFNYLTPYNNIFSDQNLGGFFSEKGSDRHFLNKICQEVGVTSFEIENTGFVWGMRIAPQISEQTNGAKPSQGFVETVQAFLLTETETCQNIDRAVHAFKLGRALLRPTIGVCVVMLGTAFASAALPQYFVSPAWTVVDAIMSFAAVVTSGLTWPLHKFKTHVLEKLESSVSEPITNQWISAAASFGFRNIALKDYMSGLEDLNDSYKEDNSFDRSTRRIIDNRLAILQESNHKPHEIKDISQVSLQKRL